ncbi:cardiolipin synthase [uncultured Vagococcus sp.]|uniref:cardiolipin synthase n=1 Tax=uncultured Vagococcus sp. TaxID=189676 RepID=UPI0028D02871|nr:cardiolipin synthase [uncultured Vagococcus sp.]
MKFLKLLTHRAAFVAFLLILQLTILFAIILRFQEYFVYFYILNILISIAIVLGIINNRSNPAYKIAWLIPIMLLPIFGTVTYLIFGRLTIQRSLQHKMAEIQKKEAHALACTIPDLAIQTTNGDALAQSTYLTNYGIVPPFKQTEGTYLPLGEDVFDAMKIEMEKAEHYIFMEYFIIEEGHMWNSLLEIMVRKAKEGVDVRLIYDDFGCIFTLPQNYDKKLEAMGIKCSIFNPFVPVLSSVFNNRNHRKIMTIDGKVAFTGGNNLADEYINAYEKHGHWKDTGIMLKGQAAWGFTLMFLSLWDLQRNEERDYCDYYPREGYEPRSDTKGYYQPYTDMPFDDETIGENVYLNLIGRAKTSIYITTPYLVIDNLLMEALCNAAKSGIDVRIQTPHLPDKWYVHAVTRSNYGQLIEAGVKIFEYTPGFIHSKTFVVDGLFATVGTINLDYRSLFLHLECGVWMYQTEVIPVMLQDFLETEALCQEITLGDTQEIGWLRNLGRAVLNVFAPLM